MVGRVVSKGMNPIKTREDKICLKMPSITMATLKPSKPQTFDRRRDDLTVSTWLFQVEVHIHHFQAINTQAVLEDSVKISFGPH